MSVCGKYEHLTSFCDRVYGLAKILMDNEEHIKEMKRLRNKVTLEPPSAVDVLPQLKLQITQLLEMTSYR